MVCGDVNYCDVKKQCFTDAKIKSINHCKDFAFCEIDALNPDEDHIYKPRKKYKQREEAQGEQLSIL